MRLGCWRLLEESAMTGSLDCYVVITAIRPNAYIYALGLCLAARESIVRVETRSPSLHLPPEESAE
jgi:hypothetical protein